MSKEIFIWTWKDLEHFKAHKKEFIRPIDTILNDLKDILYPNKDRIPGQWFHKDFQLVDCCGLSGLISITKQGIKSFWAYRVGRTIPSHLALGEKIPTNWVCLWGVWKEDGFMIHTIYPGKKAPREIHDPDIKLEELPKATEFWSKYAILTEEGEYSLEPYI